MTRLKPDADSAVAGHIFTGSARVTGATLVLNSGLFVARADTANGIDGGITVESGGTLAGEVENPKLLVSDSIGRLTTLEQPPGKARGLPGITGREPTESLLLFAHDARFAFRFRVTSLQSSENWPGPVCARVPFL